MIEVVDWSPRWAEQYEEVAAVLTRALADVRSARVEHVGSTSVPGLAAKPVLDVDVIVEPEDVPAAVAALESVGYVHRGDLGVTGREAFHAPDGPRRNVYVCTAGTANVRNHLAVRDVLRRRADLREAYDSVKRALAADPGMDIDTYIAGKSAVLQEVLEASGELSDEELAAIRRLNDAG
ncbi:GrpB family protein [Nocardioides ganghwensis]|uniref:GrpB family protein n=1 Tax=Nocardioides ganghwensis TaxID=252230 RepID=A0A4Q2SHK6_9ACTN|nr:GrpB family protein [Nocardioides ganghwensis]MBD3946251.1 GrpB family protein [Nocardioides ganghwensis]RYC03419.1 GrpB family protein [Nocardioides ganghwensis]